MYKNSKPQTIYAYLHSFKKACFAGEKSKTGFKRKIKSIHYTTC
jgi:hypothetical protein